MQRKTDLYLELAILPLEHVCVEIQEEMEGFLRTAALEKKSGIEATLRWLRRRQVKIALLSHYSREELQLILRRLHWEVGTDHLIDLVVLQADAQNPVQRAMEAFGIQHRSQALLIADTPELLRQGKAAGVQLVFGVTNGESSYQELAREPGAILLDNTVQLPDYLVNRLPENNASFSQMPAPRSFPPRLWYPAS